MTDRIDTAKEREWLDKLTGYTPGPWDASGLTVYDTCMDGVASCHADADARLIAAAPDMKATLSSALVALDAKDAEIERLRALLARNLVFDAGSAEEGLDALGGWDELWKLLDARAALNPEGEA